MLSPKPILFSLSTLGLFSGKALSCSPPPSTALGHSLPLSSVISYSYQISSDQMDESMKQLQEKLIEVEIEAENLLLARQQLVENDRVRNGNREALTALRRRAKTTKTSLPTPFESIMRAVESKPLVKELCPTCGNHDSKDTTWVMFPGTDVFANIPFHAAHTILEKDQIVLEYEAKKLQSLVKEKSFWISEQGVLADKISPGVLRSMVTLSDKPKAEQSE